MHHHALVLMIFGMCIIGIKNIGLPAKVYNTRFCKKMKNKERAQFKAHYQRELDDVKNNISQVISLLEQLL